MNCALGRNTGKIVVYSGFEELTQQHWHLTRTDAFKKKEKERLKPTLDSDGYNETERKQSPGPAHLISTAAAHCVSNNWAQYRDRE
jgi:hypothetical protein